MDVIKIWPVNVREGEGAVLKPYSSSSLNLGDRSGVVRLSWLWTVLGRDIYLALLFGQLLGGLVCLTGTAAVCQFGD